MGVLHNAEDFDRDGSSYDDECVWGLSAKTIALNASLSAQRKREREEWNAAIEKVATPFWQPFIQWCVANDEAITIEKFIPEYALFHTKTGDSGMFMECDVLRKIAVMFFSNNWESMTPADLGNSFYRELAYRIADFFRNTTDTAIFTVSENPSFNGRIESEYITKQLPKIKEILGSIQSPIPYNLKKEFFADCSKAARKGYFTSEICNTLKRESRNGKFTVYGNSREYDLEFVLFGLNQDFNQFDGFYNKFTQGNYAQSEAEKAIVKALVKEFTNGKKVYQLKKEFGKFLY